ncbi:MAG TPA: LysR family transcriptional regulator [Rhodopila sp.]|jgi:DNA-binding transcriptional LysR family regulator|nr:LysR family transcriptional regulator [Rhodopila sp.]
MDLINGLQTFIRVVETGSFSAVARESNASQSAVTRQVAQLEEHFGVRLLHRTTRKLSLTDDGQDLVTRARHLLEEAEDLQDTFGKDGGSPTGLVRIGLNIGAAVLLVPDFTAMLATHPGLAVELVVSEHAEDLIAERLDVALRLGQPADTSLVSRALTTMGSTAVAAPAYLERYGAPEHPSDLLKHTCIIHDMGPGSTHWAFTGPDGAVDVEIASAFRSNNSLVARQAATSGYGIALLGDPLTLSEIRAGRLYRLLPNYVARRRQIFIVYPSRRHLAQRTRVVIDFLIEQFRRLDKRLLDGRTWGENDATWLV